MKSVTVLLLVAILGYPNIDAAAASSRKQNSSSQSQACRATTPKQNKDLVLTAYNEIFNIKRHDRLEKYFSPTYIQHNKNIADGITGLRAYLTTGLTGHKESIFMRSAAEGDLVFVHVKSTRKDPQALSFAIVDIFRVECGLIKEHWDVLQAANTTGSLNAHPFF